MEIDEVARYVHRDQLPKAIAIIDITGEEPLDQQGALRQLLAGAHDRRSRLERPHIANRCFQTCAFPRFKPYPAFISEEAFGEHGLDNGRQARTLPASSDQSS